ncbi:MAG TPA: SAM-dependent methyltransferase [Pseudonocardiaceae bacterium]|jgi:SAM-dependent methyltransferase|nr:SAM-dependent methyltransferase [Pseudonocardiaceae bacterium]
MSQVASWVPEGLDVTRPSAARMYDYLLGGGHNFEADRQLAARVSGAHPGCWDIARLNRAFLRRAVLELNRAGVRQFLDLGSGIPTVGNVHEIAQRVDPEARVVYVDHDPVAVAHCELILEDNDRADVVLADLRDPDSILTSPITRRILDFDQPVGLLMVCVVHFIPPEEDPVRLLSRFREALAPGSYLALSHLTGDSGATEMKALVEVMRHSKDPIHPRTRSEITELFTGFELVPPGVVSVADWRPSSPGDAGDLPERDQVLAGVGIKR